MKIIERMVIKMAEQEKNMIKILEFLKETSDGKYSRVEKSSLKYTRIKELADVEEELYYFSVS